MMIDYFVQEIYYLLIGENRSSEVLDDLVIIKLIVIAIN